MTKLTQQYKEHKEHWQLRRFYIKCEQQGVPGDVRRTIMMMGPPYKINGTESKEN